MSRVETCFYFMSGYITTMYLHWVKFLLSVKLQHDYVDHKMSHHRHSGE